MIDTRPKKKLIGYAGQDDEDDFSDETIAEGIERILGRETLEKLTDLVGGTRVYFPPASRLTPDNWLVQAVGYDDAYRFCKDFMPEDVHTEGVIPLGCRAETLRNRIEELLDEGWSVRDIARNLKCHERTVWRSKRRWYESRKVPHPEQSRKCSAAIDRKRHVRRGEKARAIVRQLLLEGHSSALLRDLLAVPGDIILSIKTELIREGKL